MSFIDTVYAKLLSSEGPLRPVWRKLRRRLVAMYDDPPCRMDVHGRTLSMPLSHDLPLYYSQFPFYDRLPGRIRTFFESQQRPFVCIDVGANIGDTVAAFYGNDSDVFLAIEPNSHFSGYLKQNWSDRPNVAIAEELCLARDTEGAYTIAEDRGTASAVASLDAGGISGRTLDSIIKSYPQVQDYSVLKIDTDGHDFDVLNGARGSIERNMPFVLYEVNMFEQADFAGDCMESLRMFRDIGYSNAILYDNFGWLLGMFPTSDLPRLYETIALHLIKEDCYVDVLMVPDADAAAFHSTEVEVFIQAAGSDVAKGRLAEMVFRREGVPAV